jgi:hypothetical protein
MELDHLADQAPLLHLENPFLRSDVDERLDLLGGRLGFVFRSLAAGGQPEPSQHAEERPAEELHGSVDEGGHLPRRGERPLGVGERDHVSQHLGRDRGGGQGRATQQKGVAHPGADGDREEEDRADDEREIVGSIEGDANPERIHVPPILLLEDPPERNRRERGVSRAQDGDEEVEEEDRRESPSLPAGHSQDPLDREAERMSRRRTSLSSSSISPPSTSWSYPIRWRKP